jgi:hypothetical protein
MAFVDVSGPVGLRFKRQNVSNKSSDQEIILNLLSAIPASQGGKKEAWLIRPLSGPDGSCPKFLSDAIWDFQAFWKAKGVFHDIDGVVDPRRHTIRKLNELASGGVITPVAAGFVCGPNVTNQIIRTWTKVQADFRAWTEEQKITACDKILIPVQIPNSPLGIPTDLDQLKKLAQQFADINGWDTMPLFQGASAWLRRPPVFIPARNGPCATPSSKKPGASAFDDAHEDPDTCSDSVEVAGQCWLNGTVNYGLFGVMVRLCSDFAATSYNPVRRAVYSLEWATGLIQGYKRFGSHPEGAIEPVAWTTATFNGGPGGRPTIPGNRPKCKCSCGCSADTVPWDYVWEPLKPRATVISP